MWIPTVRSTWIRRQPPEFEAELERRASEHRACAHEWQLLSRDEIQGDPFLAAFTVSWSVASRCTRCRALSFQKPGYWIERPRKPPR